MTSKMSVVSIVGTGVAISAVYQIRHGRDPFPVIAIGCVWIGTVAVVAELNPELGMAFAAVYLVSIVLTRGSEFFDWLNDLTSGLNNDGSVKRPRKQRN